MGLLCTLLDLFFIAVFGRIILSWFPLQPGSALASVFSFLYSVTEPVMGPVRRAIPPMGVIDISPIVVIFGVQILGGALLGCRVGFL